MECMDGPKDCKGEVQAGPSRSGASRYEKCEKHWDDYDVRMDKVHADISSRYPGYDVPGSPPPPGFDPTYAGERWDEDY